jgi:hypothetical protein
METLPKQFDDTLTRIEVSATKRARAIEAHLEVRAVLATSSRLVKWGIETVLIGSYARQTSIYPGRDVDIFSKLTKLETTASPSDIFSGFCEVLTNHYKERAEPRARSVKVKFSDDGFSVDAVPAVKADNRWAIPAHDRGAWAERGARWVLTDPERLTQLVSAANKKPKVSGQGAFVPVVKLMRQAREHHRGDAKPGGLYIELAVYHTFLAGLQAESFAELLAGTLQAVAGRLQVASVKPLIDPALGTPFTPPPDEGELAHTANTFSTLAAKAARALVVDACQAAVLWREILGRNDRGVVFPLPSGCDETGKAIQSVTANRGRGSDEARGFG